MLDTEEAVEVKLTDAAEAEALAVMVVTGPAIRAAEAEALAAMVEIVVAAEAAEAAFSPTAVMVANNPLGPMGNREKLPAEEVEAEEIPLEAVLAATAAASSSTRK